MRGVTIELRNSAARFHCQPYRSVGSKFVSAESLPKTGVFTVLAGDFRKILARVAIFRSLETNRKCTKSLQNARFSPTRGSLSLVERVPGWGGRYRTSIWRFRNRLLLPVREELQNPNCVSVHKPLETLEFGEPYRIRGLQSSGEK